MAFVHLPKPLRDKLEPRALRCVFVGYASLQKGYHCYHPPSRKMFVTLDVVFHENDMYYTVLESSIQGERQNELQTLNLNPSLVHLDTSGEFLDKSGECLEEEIVCPEEEIVLHEQPVLDQPDVNLNGENNQN